MAGKIAIFLFLVLFSFQSIAQDLNARVQILSPQIQNTNKRALDVLENAIRDFLNNRKWSEDNLLPQERIDCNIVLNIKEWDGSSNFKAEAQIQSSRPVFNTTYNSTILNISDKDFNFTYSEGQTLDYSDQNFINNLSSMLAYYAYIIVGLDYDTFMLYGGSSYFAKAQAVVNNAQNSGFTGWKAFEGLRNRYWLVENLNNKTYNPLREALYDYHKNGLDAMTGDQVKGRKVIVDILPKLQKIDKQKQGSMLSQLFFTAKADEFVSILEQLSPQEKIKAINILSTLDPTNVNKYESLKKSR